MDQLSRPAILDLSEFGPYCRAGMVIPSAVTQYYGTWKRENILSSKPEVTRVQCV